MIESHALAELVLTRPNMIMVVHKRGLTILTVFERSHSLLHPHCLLCVLIVGILLNLPLVLLSVHLLVVKEVNGLVLSHEHDAVVVIMVHPYLCEVLDLPLEYDPVLSSVLEAEETMGFGLAFGVGERVRGESGVGVEQVYIGLSWLVELVTKSSH